ncbi:uncharacterized protein LOC144651110 isoform X4 [Oculina patagonica]
MKTFVACVVLAVALPCAMGIMCYDCTPSGVGNMCDNPTNVTNCTGPFDACVAMAMKISMKNPIAMSMTMRVMSCTVKAGCSQSQAVCANVSSSLAGALPGATVDGCEAKCCETDKCNNQNLVQLTTPAPSKPGPTALAAYTGASLTISILSLLAGLAISFY